MLSSELAAAAGVTVRTLRHYHQIGLLHEPERSAGGYRRYTVDDLVRLLRISRLVGLGVPLAAMPAVLDDPAAAEKLLEELDRQAVAEIDRLSTRRATIAALRRTGGSPDLAPELSVWLLAPEAAVPAEMARFDRDQLVLLGHLLGADGAAGLAAVFEVVGPERPAIDALSARFYGLAEDAAPDEVAALTEELVALLRPLLARIARELPLDAQGSALIDELGERALHPAQREVLRRVDARLS